MPVMLDLLVDLPRALALHCLSLVPLDSRLRARGVSRAWRHLLADESLWAALDFSPASGIAARVSVKLIAAAVRLARGHVRSLSLLDCDRIAFVELHAIVAAHGGALTELRLGRRASGCHAADMHWEQAATLMRCAPQLRLFEASVHCPPSQAAAMLRGEPPFGTALRVRELRVCGTMQDGMRDEAVARAFATDLASHVALQRLSLSRITLSSQGAVTALADAAVSLRLNSLQLWECKLQPVALRSLARLLTQGALEELTVSSSCFPLIGGPDLRAFCVALHASKLRSLHLYGSGLCDRPQAAAAVVEALSAHATLSICSLVMCLSCAPDEQRPVGAALGAMLAADAPALTALNVSYNFLEQDDGLVPLFAGLALNTHLRTLQCGHNRAMDERFARQHILPAVQTNRSLREFAMHSDAFSPAVQQAQDLVAARSAAC